MSQDSGSENKMNPTVKDLCDQAFHRFLRSQPYELDPESSIYRVAKAFFIQGFSEGGMEGAKRTAEAIRKDLDECL